MVLKYKIKNVLLFITEKIKRLFIREANLLAFWNKIPTSERFRITLFNRIKRNMRIFGVIPFIKVQDDT